MGGSSLSAHLKSLGHETGLRIQRDEKDFPGSIREFDPQVFLITVDVLGSLWALDMMRLLKREFGLPVILAGTFVSLYPQIIEEPGVDTIIRGEAEYAAAELLERMERGQSINGVANVWRKENGRIHRNNVRELVSDLDSLPMPDRALYFRYPHIRDITTKRFTSGRGCPNVCGFCYNAVFRNLYKGKGPYVRKKSVKRIVDEIVWMKENSPLGHIHFSDDLFIVDPDWLDEFAEDYSRRVGLPFTCNVSADMTSEAIIRLLKRAGCSGIAVGLETGNETQRRELLRKSVTNQQFRDTAAWMKQAGIPLVTSNIIGIPGETLENIFETIRFNRELEAKYARVFLAFPLAGTKMTESAAENNYLNGFLKNKDENQEYQEKYRFNAMSVFDLPHRLEANNLLYLFRVAISHPRAEKLIRFLMRLPLTPLYRLLSFNTIYLEKRFLRVTWLSGFRYFLHTGNPSVARTKIFNNYIP